MGLFSKLFRKKDADFNLEEQLEELEELLISSDAGSGTALWLVEKIRKVRSRIRNQSDLQEQVRSILTDLFYSSFQQVRISTEIRLILFLGVNGSGKTTSLIKMAHILKECGKKIKIIGADTYRTAAFEQLQEWAKRAGLPMANRGEHEEPAAIIHEALQSEQENWLLLADTAGRMHNNDNLMRELEKINRIALKQIGEKEIFRILVLDSRTGQNTMNQVLQFKSLFHIHGIILTKTDSSSKGGILLRIAKETELPVLYTTNGEELKDIHPFQPEQYINSLLS